jgi:FkbM family methyltransferase
MPGFVTRFLKRCHQSRLVSDSLSAALENTYAVLRGKKVRFTVEKDGSFYAEEGGRKLQISNKQRGFWLYRNGINTREKFLFDSYCLQNIKFDKDDVIFDCGANSGDLFLRLSKLIKPSGYYGFEPNPLDFKVLSVNAGLGANLFNLALGNVNSELSFYTYTRGGDSSLIKPKVWDEEIRVSVVRLDSFMLERGVTAVKLLKLEAEGFEPEILEGLGSMIRYCEYIAVDGGYERGENCEQTLTTCTNYLLSNGFEMLDIYFPGHRALYRRKINL